MTPSPARNPSRKVSTIAALPGTRKNLTSGDFSRGRETISKSLKTPFSATTPRSLATWPTNLISARLPSPGTPPPTKSNPDCGASASAYGLPDRGGGEKSGRRAQRRGATAPPQWFHFEPSEHPPPPPPLFLLFIFLNFNIINYVYI